jgi:phosphatidylserine/phosphatidylglycerophosphate/cardiolipin synthase-like enzyme
LAELAKAKKSVHFLTFSLTDVEIGRTMVEKARAGVQVGGIFDRWLAAGQYSLFDQFRSEKLSVLRDGNEALMHHKAIIIDGSTVISGSYNYSQNAERNNNEAFVIVKRAPTIANAFEAEYQRLVKAAKTNRPPPHKPKDPEHKVGNEP